MSNGVGPLMAETTVWEITIRRRDGSRLRFSESRFDDPGDGEIIQAGDVGEIVKARIDTCQEGLSKGGSVPVCFQVIATEIIE